MGTLQQQSILKGCNITYNDDKILVHRIFQTIAKKFPKRAAILYDDEAGEEHCLSYEELDSCSNRIARVLRKICPGNREENFAAVSVTPTHRLPLLLTAILKAGMAYLPLDVEFPGARVKHIMQEAEPSVVIIESDADKSIYDGRECITMDELLEKANEESSDNLEIEGNEGQLAIVLYTSGSTGVPKGVKLPHATLLNRLQWQWRELPYARDEDRCVFKTALTFVDSAPEIWGPLLQGRTIIVVPRHSTKDPQQFITILEKHKIQRLVLVPSLLQSLLLYLDLQKSRKILSELRLWICSGETLPKSLAEKFFARFGSAGKILANFYGSTEVMGDVTFHLLREAPSREVDRVPIGKPVDNSIIYIVNKDMRVVPHGEVGEMLVAGKNLAAGYIRGRDPHRFLDNPHAIDPEYPKVFRTGDYAKIVKGTIFYEGRTDAQIKVRGHKVDLAEIEKAVAIAPAVDKAVVLCYKPGELSQNLVAFVTAKVNASISSQQIEDFLSTNLPPYMVPQVLVVDSIPLLTNGKTDRQALLKDYETLSVNGSIEPAECSYDGIPEEHLDKAKILFPTVASVIGRGVRGIIDVNSNFYELGGNSLNSVYTVTKLRDQGYQISISDFITAKCMAEILAKMKVNWDSDGFEDLSCSKEYVFEYLNDSHKEDVVQMITKSFYSKADLEQWLIPDIKRDDYRILINKIWNVLTKKGFSFVIKSVADGKILGVALNLDARDEPEVDIDSKLTVIFEFLEYLEGPIRDTKLPKGLGKIYHSFMMTTSEDLSPSDNVIMMKEMEYYCLEVAKEKGFAGIFTTNTSPLTQQLGTDVYNYEVLLDYQVNKYVAPDGSRPFGKAPDDQRAVCSWKPIV